MSARGGALAGASVLLLLSAMPACSGGPRATGIELVGLTSSSCKAPTQVLFGVVPVRAVGEGPAVLTRVSFSVNEGKPQVDDKPPFQLDLDTTTLPDGTARLSAEGTDMEGGTVSTRIEICVDNTGPQLTLLAPSDGAVVGIEDATLPVRLNATDVLGVERITARLEVSGGFQEKTCTPPAGPDAVCVMEPTGLGLKVAAGGGADGAISVTVRDKAGHETQVRRKLRLNTRLKWRFVAGSRISWAAAPLAGGKVAVGTDTDGAKVFVVDPQGTQVCVWDAGKASTGNPDGVATPPTPSADGTRFFFATVERLVSLGVDCAVKWTVSGGTYTGSQPAYAEKSDVVFVGRDGDANTPPTLRAHRGANGNLLQSVDLGGAESKNKGATSSPALSPDGSVVYVGAPDANLYAFKVNPSGTLLLTPLWKYTTGTEIGTRPLVTDQRVYVASGSFLHACDRATGTKVSDFTFKAEAPIYSSPVLSRDGATLYIGSLDESLYALDPQSGKEVGKSKVGRMMFTSPAVGEGGMVYAASTPEPGRLYGLSLTLETRWFIDPEQANQFRASPILVGNVLYLGNYNGSLYAVDVTPPAS